MAKQFVNPPNSKEILETMASISDSTQAELLINKYFPDWIVHSLPRYSSDYSYLDQNWQRICDKLNVSKQKIVLVSDITFDSDHSTINQIAELMTKHGYVVRRQSEFGFCPVCAGAIPCMEVWRLMKEKDLPVPNMWSDTCSNC